VVATTALAQETEDFSNRGNFGAPVCIRDYLNCSIIY
jgi:hypothetical protein